MELARSLQRHHSPHSVHGSQHLTIKVNLVKIEKWVKIVERLKIVNRFQLVKLLSKYP
jgi:hypothetical protein